MFKNKVLKEMNSLNPNKDYWKIVQLSVGYEFPWDFTRSLELALYKTFAVPSIAKILYNSKQFQQHGQKRYDDTDILLSEIIDYGLNSEHGQRALQKINWIHAHYPIKNEDYLYVLSTFVFEPEHWINTYGYRKLTHNERISGFKVWHEIGTQMNIKDIPDSIEEMRAYYLNYEATHFKYHEHNALVAKATEDIMLGWYLPKFMFDWLRPILHAVMQPNLLQAFQFKDPGQLIRLLVTFVLKARSITSSFVPRTTPFIRTQMNNYRYYNTKGGYQFIDLGPDKLKTSACPYHALQDKLGIT